jgi:hypothetical protein
MQASQEPSDRRVRSDAAAGDVCDLQRTTSAADGKRSGPLRS